MKVGINVNVRETAEWMISQLDEKGYLLQKYAAYTIREHNPDLVYINKNRNLALSEQVLREFGKMKSDDIIWTRKAFLWRKIKK